MTLAGAVAPCMVAGTTVIRMPFHLAFATLMKSLAAAEEGDVTSATSLTNAGRGLFLPASSSPSLSSLSFSLRKAAYLAPSPAGEMLCATIW
ncbi:MAG: hypothetical protein BWY00_01787 [Firmicutes bacterium ADurb.Bin153]|nr:MAG: hypothetical protein BWY00_01787 [Firmicutes bacterium ADurb.Bin153]